MKASDWLAVVGIVASGLLTAATIALTAKWSRDRFRAEASHWIQRTAVLCQLVANELMDGSIPKADSDLSPEFREALVVTVRAAWKELVAAVAEDALNADRLLHRRKWISRTLRPSVPPSKNALDRENMWQAMLANGLISVERDQTTVRSLLGTVLQVLASAHVIIVVLGLPYDEADTVGWLKAGMAGADPDGPAGRMRQFGEVLLPRALFAEVTK